MANAVTIEAEARARAGKGVADHHRCADTGEPLCYFLEQPLDTRPARHQRAGGQAFRAARGDRLCVPAMMAEQAAGRGQRTRAA